MDRRIEATLVACYGAKDGPLADLIEGMQRLLVNRLGSSFVPYAVEQVHATIVGLEAWCRPAGPVQVNHRDRYGDEAGPMDFAAMMDVISQVRDQPLRIQIGGYRPWISYGFDSQRLHPYMRSFWLGGGATSPTREVVVMGWPANANLAWRPLDSWRRRFEFARVGHKYHTTPMDIDDDFFMVLGVVEDQPGLTQVAADLRAHLASVSVPVAVSMTNLSLVEYADTLLPVESSVSHPVSDLSAHSLAALYAGYCTGDSGGG